jgi:hypothetical protein
MTSLVTLLTLLLSCLAAWAANVTNLYTGQQLSPGMRLTSVPGAFQPDQLDGLQLWFKADAMGHASGVQTNWLDSSGHGRHATNSVGQPRFVADQLNGLPAYLFTNNNCLGTDLLQQLSERRRPDQCADVSEDEVWAVGVNSRAFKMGDSDDSLDLLVRIKSDAATPHLGPMAQDFRADDKHIATVDADGVALAAIQGLNQKLTEELKRRDTENAELRTRLERLERLLNAGNGGGQ